MSEGAVQRVAQRVMSMAHEGRVAQREEMEPALIVFSPFGWNDFRADPEIFAYIAPTVECLEDQSFFGCKIEIDPRAEKPFRVLSAHAAAERAEARSHRRVV